MSVCRKLPDGTIQKIAGHTILLDANASEIRQGTWYLRKDSAGTMTTDITFTDPMPDTDYVVILEPSNQFNWDEQNPGPIGISNKTTTGFTLSCYAFGPVYIFGGKYTAFKPVKIEGYTELQNKVNNPDDTPTIDSMNLVTSDGVARAIENASAVWKGTKAEWNALPATTKIKYDLAVLLDQTLVKAIDRETGDENDVADLTKVFTGTDAEWAALSTAEKTSYALSATSDRNRLHSVDRSTGDVTEVADLSRIWRGTKEEWEAMSAAEKDEYDQAELVAAPSDVDLNFNYSTDETLTGATWYDGKPVYRRVFTNLPISSTWTQHNVDNSNYDSLASYTILGKSGVSGDTHTTPYFNGTGDNFQVAVVAGVGILAYWGSASAITSFDMVVEYTKTTD